MNEPAALRRNVPASASSRQDIYVFLEQCIELGFHVVPLHTVLEIHFVVNALVGNVVGRAPIAVFGAIVEKPLTRFFFSVVAVIIVVYGYFSVFPYSILL